ncbi:GntR family transcriptional regulator [Nocardia arthritidis]|uniref:UTRA domain-containing protein n=1 Tax=Nocardia arthritidis TaxID=228602 RepID=A0A6G9Y8D5_9NOCA|nr:GntR family transcriptional regulator [Nocardia arthritidis]QIS09380.1 UTRA domain-containing protein [Nocardia arthritidis]
MAQWEDIATDLRARIAAREWAPGQQLPPMRALADRYKSASHAPVNRAVLALIGEGVLITDPNAPRRGVRVRSQQVIVHDLIGHSPATGAPGERTFEQAFQVEGELDVRTSYAWQDASTRVAQQLQIDPGTPILIRTFVYMINNTPHQLARAHMTADLAREIGLTDESVEVPGRNTAAWLGTAGIKVSREHLEISVRTPTQEEREILLVPPAVAVIQRDSVTYSETTPVEYWLTTVVADQVRYTIDFIPDRMDQTCL